ncbi:MAG: V-type ATPase subunit [Ruminococcus sp.]|nr:V-type ATPase subunit [Ruminococcus sp.]
MSFKKETKYADGVAAVKAMESTLLTAGDIEQLISASTKAEAESLLNAKRGSGEALSLESVWSFLQDYAPDCAELKLLLYKNDFHNLKAALKAVISGKEPERYYLRPTLLELDTLSGILLKKDYPALPEHIRDTAERAYELLTRTMDGQLADSLIDSAAVSTLLNDAERTGNDFMIKYAELTEAAADIKTAYRCSVMGKNTAFLELAVAGGKDLEKDQLISAALSGTESLFEYLDTTPYSEAAALLKRSPVAFEKWCDDAVMELAESARLLSFGSEPLAAYYIAAETGLKNLRILTVCRESGADRETITERMRRLYV